MDPTYERNPKTDRPTGRWAGKLNRRWFRFRLLDVLLLTALVAAWLPYFLATRQFESLEAENASLRRVAEILVVDDPSKIHVLKVLSNRYGASEWKVFVPESSNYELRFATEEISSLSFPRKFQQFPLDPGEHRISMIHEQSSRGHSFRVFVDYEPAIVQEHPREWIDYGSSGATSTGDELKQFAVGEVVALKQTWFDEKLPGFPHSYGRTRNELSNKGSFAWLAPVSMVHPPPPRFVTPENLRIGRHKEWGFREGIRIRLSQFSFPGDRSVPGSIQIVHTGTRHSKDVPLNQLAIKPKLDGQHAYANSTTESSGKPGGKVGLEFATSDSMAPAANSWQAGVVSEDGNSLRLFIHPGSFSSGARPVIEVLFDAQHPNRVGFCVHADAESATMRECVLSAMDGSFAQLRRIHFAGGQVKTAKQLFPQWHEETSAAAETSPWKTCSADQFPLVDRNSLRRVRLTSDVGDYSNVKYPGAVQKAWQYVGLSAQQSWLFSAETPATVAVRARKYYANGNGPIPGGPALEDFELRTPLQPNHWIWYEVVPNPERRDERD